MPEQVHRNGYVGGINRDLSKTKYKNTYYYHLENGRIITDKGLSTGAVENIKGNSKFLKIPVVLQLVAKPGITSGTFTVPSNAITIIDSNNYSYSNNSAYNQSYSNVEELFDIYENIFSSDLGYSYLKLQVKRVSEDELHITSSVEDLSSILQLFTGKFLLTKLDPVIIGWNEIRDSIILFTTPVNSETHPDYDNGGIGNIWRIDYNPVGNIVNSIKLIYTNHLNFTIKHPIIDETESIYENTEIQRVYWTDHFNPPRVVNIADPDIQDEDPNTLNLTSTIQLSKPLIISIEQGGGNLIGGVYEYAYRLRTLNGSDSKISPLSSKTIIVSANEVGSPYWNVYNEYNGYTIGVSTGKSIKIEVRDLDTNFDTIDLISVYVGSLGIPEIKVVETKPVPLSGIITFIHSGLENDIETIELEEFTSTGDSVENSLFIKKCKTIATKDNRLFLANVELLKTDNIKFNARTYRYTSAANGKVTYVTDPNVDPFDETISQSDKDAINPFNLDDTQEYMYQSDGVTLGGEGPNISYKFVVEELDGDIYNGTSQPAQAPFIDKNRSTRIIDLGIDNQEHPHKNMFYDYKSSYVSGNLTGYARGEIYRFGIVLYDLQGNPIFTEWIGDIKFPETYTGIKLGDNNRFVVSEVINGVHKLKVIGLEFKVNIPADIQSQIGGYSIVRVERDQPNKTVLGMGVANVCTKHEFRNTPTGGATTSRQISVMRTMKGLMLENTAYNSFTSLLNKREFDQYPFADAICFDSPDAAFNRIADSTLPTDKLRIVGSTIYSGTGDGYRGDFLGNGTSSYRKHYYHNNPNTSIQQHYDVYVQRAYNVDEGGAFPMDDSGYVGYTFYNYAVDLFNVVAFPSGTGGDFYDCYSQLVESVGAKTLVVVTDTPMTNLNQGHLETNYPICSYRRQLSEQYGGNTYVNRSVNTYITCNNYIPISRHNPASYFQVWGGDTYTVIYDATLLEKNRNQGQYFTSNSQGRELYGMFAALESSVNTELRLGHHFANKLYTTVGVAFDDGGSLGDIISAYGAFDANATNILTYIPKPEFKTFPYQFDNECYYSQQKFNGESLDAWRIFKVGNNLAVEGKYGPINRLEVLKDNIFYIQDRAFGVYSINPKAAVNAVNADGLESIQLGTGLVLDDFRYVSKEFGSKHQWSVTSSDRSIFFFDIIRKKFVEYNPQLGVTPASDVKGLHEFFTYSLNGGIQIIDHYNNQLSNDLLRGDNPLLGIGISTIYDPTFNEVIMTFQDRILSNTGINTLGGLSIQTFGFEYPKYTVVYNENLNAFSAFYGFKSPMYLTDKRNLFSLNPNDLTQLYIHNQGEYGVFYDQLPEDLILEIIVNPQETDVSKLFNNIEFLSEVYDEDGNDVYDVTLNSIRAYNEYQDSGTIQLTNPTNIRRRMRTWRTQIPRDTNSRMRNSYLRIVFTFDNTNNYRLVLHDILTHYNIQAL